MFRKLTLFLSLTVCAFTFSNLSFATNYVNNGTPVNYNLTAVDSLYIASGTYTGNITGFVNGAKIAINSGATFQPGSFPNTGGGAGGIIWNYGTAIFGSNMKTGTGFTLNNYGIFSVSGTVTISGNNQTWTNNIGGVMNFYADVTVNGVTGDLNNSFINYETVNCTGTFKMNSGSSFYNYKNFNVTGTFQANGGILESTGKLKVTGNILMNSGTSIIRNYCSMTATTGINNTNGAFYNYSFLWAQNSDISNSGTFINVVFNHSTPMMQGKNFTISTGSTFTGPCLLYFDGTTKVTGGSIGVAGVTTDTIKMYDVTKTGAIFDTYSGGTIHPNVIYNAWGVPDTNYHWYWGCSYEYLQDVPLAINWNYFYVYLSDKVPVLNWSADYDEGTVFEIQRSYDGRNFTSIKQVASEVGRSQYTYNDLSVNNNSAIAYYRILAIEPSGLPKFSQIRSIRFNNKPGTLHIFPNPFVNNFVIDYNAKERQDLIIKIFNAAGQQKFAKKISVHDGSNRIEINEVEKFSKGVYIVQISDGTSIISSGKIIKQ